MFQNHSVTAQYVEGLQTVKSGASYGFMNERGEMVVPAIYDMVQDFREGNAFVQREKWGEIDKKGEVIIPLIYDSIRRFSSGAVVVRLDNKLGLFRSDGKEICPAEYEDIRVWYNLFAVKRLGKWGFIDQKGRIVLPIEFDTEPVIATYDLTMKKDGLIYTIDYKGEVVDKSE